MNIECSEKFIEASAFSSQLGKKLLSAFALLSSFSAIASDGSFIERCNGLASQSQIEVVFEDRNVTRDDSWSRVDLSRLSQSNQNPYHIVLGLTHAEPSANLVMTTQFLADSDGKICGVPSLKVKLGFSTLQIYLAKELENSCRRNIVLSHEQEHVAVWRNHLRAGSKLLSNVLQAEFRRAEYFSNRDEADVSLRQQVQKSIAFHLNNLKSGISNAHQQIDSPASYRYEEGRMRACP